MKKLISLAFGLLIMSNAFATGHTASISFSTNVSCYGGSDGTATASVSGGVGPFGYSWAPTGATTASVTGLSAGSYTVTVTDNSDMSTATAILIINQPMAVTITMNATYPVCAGSCVTLSPMVIGGSPPYTYAWTPAASLSSPVVYSPTSCPAVTTTYTITAMDGNGCVGSAATTVIVDPPINLATSALPATCFGTCDGQAVVIPSGGSGSYTYQWTDPGMQTTAAATGLCAGTYAVVVVDADGCVAADSVVITQDPAIVASFAVVQDSADANTVWTLNTSSGGTYYAWDFGDGSNSTLMSPTHYYAPGVMTVCLVVNNSSGCGDTVCQTVTVTGSLDPCMSMFHIAPNNSTAGLNDYTVYNLSYGSPLTYLWDFGDTTTSTLANPTHVYSTSTGPYQICLTIDNGSGCSHTYCDTIYSVDSLSRASDPISFTVVDVPAPIITGIDAATTTVGVNVYPNPFSDQTTFVISDKTNATYTFEMTDVLGKKVMEIGSITEGQFNISRSGLQNGFYFYKIYSAESTVNIGKLIVK